MYIINGIAYAGEFQKELEVEKIKILDDLILLVTFSSGETRLFDTTVLLQYPVFKILEDEKIFKTASIDNGILIWNNGELDIATETLYQYSYPYKGMLKI